MTYWWPTFESEQFSLDLWILSVNNGKFVSNIFLLISILALYIKEALMIHWFPNSFSQTNIYLWYLIELKTQCINHQMQSGGLFFTIKTLSFILIVWTTDWMWTHEMTLKSAVSSPFWSWHSFRLLNLGEHFGRFSGINIQTSSCKIKQYFYRAAIDLSSKYEWGKLSLAQIRQLVMKEMHSIMLSVGFVELQQDITSSFLTDEICCMTWSFGSDMLSSSKRYLFMRLIVEPFTKTE
jgi:hypothetical protein